MVELNKPHPELKKPPMISSDYPDGTVIRVRKSDGMRFWHLDGKLHRNPAKGPAVEKENGTGHCYKHGVPLKEEWVDVVEEIVVAPVAPPPQIVIKTPILKATKARMSYTEFQLQQARSRSAEEARADDEEPTLADLSRLFKIPPTRNKSKHRR